jgi:uncharacterized membrane protein YgcG
MTNTIRRVPVLVLATALVAIATIAALAATQAQAALRHFDGTVIGKNADSKKFRIRTESGNRVSFKVNRGTDFERIAGFGGLHKGVRVEVDARRSGEGWIAKQVEKRGSGGGGGDDHGGGNGDDHGGGHGGGGGDDPPGHH